MERRIKKYLREIEEDANPNKVFIKIKLNLGVNKTNAALLLLIFFIAHLNIIIQLAFINYLLEDHYHVYDDRKT